MKAPKLVACGNCNSMAKKILFESAVHQFATAGRRLASERHTTDPAWSSRLGSWVRHLRFVYSRPHGMVVSWTTPSPGEYLVKFEGAQFYTRGDLPPPGTRVRKSLLANGDEYMRKNREFSMINSGRRSQLPAYHSQMRRSVSFSPPRLTFMMVGHPPCSLPKLMWSK